MAEALLEAMERNPRPRWLTASYAAAILALLGLGAWFFYSQKASLQKKTVAELEAIAHLKVEQIAQWRAERLADGAMFARNPLLAEEACRFLSGPPGTTSDELLAVFRAARDESGYTNVLLADTAGNVRLGLGDQPDTLHAQDAAALDQSFRERRPVLTDLFISRDGETPRCDVVAPLLPAGGPATNPVGAVILRTDVRRFLYPLIQSWPTPSETAETLLVRRDGDSVLYLNELRHRSGTALSLRLPMTRVDMPAVRAVLGHEGAFEGIDYRGVPVLSVTRAAPDSPWFMVAKVDAAEAFAAWRSRSNLILTLLAVLGATIVAVGAVVRQRRRATGLQELASLLESRVRERTSELEVRAAQLRALAAELTKTEERERRRLAQVLHDHLQQLLVGAKFKVAALKGRVADDSVNAALNQLSDLTDQCIAASRSLTAELAPPALYAQDLLGALRWLARWMDEKHGLAVTAHADDHGEEVDLDHRAFLFNAVRELLFNVAKHAETRQATVTVSRRDERVIAVTVEDHGCGFAAPKAGTSDKLVGGLGLFSVRERLSALGGRLEIDSAPGKGARVTVIMPLPRGEAAADAGASSSSQ